MIEEGHPGAAPGALAPEDGGGQRMIKGVLLVLALAYLGLQVAATYTEGINWDEFALLHRAERTLATGKLDAGGRPGLVVLALLPWARGCTDSVAALRQLRLVWVGLTGLYLAGVFVFVRRVLRSTRASEGWVAAALAVGFLALAPPFLRWSVQVRTDQVALAGAIWAGVLLVGTKRRWQQPLSAGLLLGLGYLASQKALYVGALVVALAAAEPLLALLHQPRAGRGLLGQEVVRAVLLAAGLGATVLVYRIGVALTLTPPGISELDNGLKVFEFYREALGYQAYLVMVPGLWPQLLVVVLLLLGAFLGPRAARSLLTRLWVLVALGLGLAVGMFHAATFPYFWLTLGAFPAIACGLAWPTVRAFLRASGWRLELALLTCLLAGALPMLRSRWIDTQRVQRESMHFVREVLPATARGFQVEGALTCRADAAPLPRMLSQHIRARFYGPEGAAVSAAFCAEFSSRPISFLIDSWRLEIFPDELRTFWRDHYVPYRAAVWVLGRRFRVTPGAAIEFDLLADGQYRLWGLDPTSQVRAEVDGKPLAGGEALPLAAGRHEISFTAGQGLVLLALDLAVGPEGSGQRFYSPAQTAELRGYF